MTRSQSISKEQILAAKIRSRELRRRSTPAERKFWERVRDRRFLGLKFYRQHPFFFGVADHDTFAIADFYCDQVKLAVEIDGKIHDDQKEKDAVRTEIINCFGVNVVRFTNEEIEGNFNDVLRRLEQQISNLLSSGTAQK